MPAAPLPPDEAARLAALRAFGVLDTPPEPEYDDLTRLAAAICGVSVSVVTLIDDERQWFKSKLGLDLCETRRDLAFCGYTILGDDLLEVPDATLDPRFADHPFVTDEPGIRFYAGVPLIAPSGHNLGAVCVVDFVPRTLTDAQRDALRVLGRQVMAHFQLHKQAAELREREEQFRAFMDNSPAVAFMKDEDGRYAYINEPGVRRFGRPAEQWLGHTDEELFPAAYGAVWRDNDRAVLANGEVAEFSETVPEADGGESHWHTYKFPFRDATGRQFLAGIGLDVTEKKRAEAGLRDSEHKFRSLIEQAVDAVFLTGPDGVIRDVNRRACDSLGYTREELLGGTFRQLDPFLTPDTHARVLAELDAGRTACFETRHRRKDGTDFPVEIRMGRLDLDGQPCRMSIARDVTDRKTAEAALLASEEQYRALAEGTSDLVHSLGLDGTIRYVNTAWQTMLGYTADEVVGRPVLDLVHPEDRAYATDVLRRLLAGEEVGRVEGRVVTKAGAARWVEGTTTRRVEDGRAVGTWTIYRDVTDRKRAEAAVQASEAKFRGVVDRLAEGLVVVDAGTGRVVEANAAMLAMLGYTPGEFLTLNMFDLLANVTPESFARLADECRGKLADHGRCDLGRRQFRRKDGAAVPVDVKATLVPDGGAGLNAVIVRDVTDELRQEEMLFGYQMELEAANARLRAQANTDKLTGVSNRAAFDERLAEAHQRASRNGRPLSLAMLDMDHFKQFNDLFGHPAGDDALRMVATRLAETVRGTDAVARYGGEEFAVILPDTDYAGAMVLAERCRRAVAAADWDHQPVTVSVGVATLVKGYTAADLVEAADQALYQSKRAGRNRVIHGSGSIGMAALVRG